MRLFFIAALALSQAYVVFSQQAVLHASLTCGERAKQAGMSPDGWEEVYDSNGIKKCRRTAVQEICHGVEFIDPNTKEKGCCPDDTNVLTWIDKPAQIGKCCGKDHVWTPDSGSRSEPGGCCPVGHHMNNGRCVTDTPTAPSQQCPVGTHLVGSQCVPTVSSVNPYPQTCGNGHGGVEPSCTCTNNPVCGHGKYLGIKYGHCYILSFSDGQQLGLNRDKPDYVKNGLFDDIPFKVCKSPTDCSSGEEVEMGQSFSLQDQHGLYDDVLGTKGWINNAFGGHSMFTPNGNEAGKFNGIPTCAGGECALQLRGGPINTALKFTCPTDTPSVSSYGNPKVGTKLRFSEVTCDDYEVPPTSGINQN
ncbi:hypothetical protein DEU56DRAFT_919708 [Suillus clintonianus]|uniref:uncharacterized protein n=1 Tax=Suillus clintonianus TaxID=1904413 RepID=UPI001B86953E|nr:uncharacterized protein DEU56DRAFT_919708 [Suillus clintonianus]KAG2113378.1 hypothetical protein DEU56DRAFT_919708 [Suillus clintonianus]